MNRSFRFVAVLAGLILTTAGGDWILSHADAQQAKPSTPVTAPTRLAVTSALAERSSWYFPAQFVNQAKDIEAHLVAF